eukprot:1355261-Amorphochlora_amoeboformis.AAC.1
MSRPIVNFDGQVMVDWGRRPSSAMQLLILVMLLGAVSALQNNLVAPMEPEEFKELSTCSHYDDPCEKSGNCPSVDLSSGLSKRMPIYAHLNEVC